MISGAFDRRFVLAGVAALVPACTIGGPAFAQTQPYSIFFNSQETGLGDTAKEIISLISKSLKANARVTITGHCDSKEPDPDKLSLARAMAVENELVQHGVPAGVQLTIVGMARKEQRKPPSKELQDAVNRYVSVTVK